VCCACVVVVAVGVVVLLSLAACNIVIHDDAVNLD